MNKAIGVQPPYCIEDVTKILEPELLKLLHILKENIIPPADQCELLCELLAQYTEVTKPKPCVVRQKPPAKIVRFIDYADDAKYTKDKALLQNDHVISLLCKACFEKLVSRRNGESDQALLQQLVDAQLLMNIGFENGDSEDDYFTLTSKGWGQLKSKNFQRKAQYSLPTLPVQLCIDTKFWNETTFRQAKQIKQYYQEQPTANGNIVFAFPQSKQLLFGCAVSEDVDVSYVYAYSQDDSISKADVKLLCEIIESPEVQLLTIVSVDTICMDDMPIELKNAAGRASANIVFYKLGI